MDNLVNNYYFLERLAPALHQQVKGRAIIEVYEQNKQEYVFLLEPATEAQALVFYYGHQLSFVFMDQKAKPKAGALTVFKEFNGQVIRDVQVIPNDRSLLINFEGPYQLLFKLYGAHGNVILFQEGIPLNTIRKRIQKDQTAPLTAYQEIPDPSKAGFLEALNAGKTPANAIQQVFPTFTKDFQEALAHHGFEQKATPEEQWECLLEFLQALRKAPLSIHHEATNSFADTGVRLSFFRPEAAQAVFDDPMNALHAYARQFLKLANLLGYKQKLVSYWQGFIKKHRKRVKNLNSNLQKLVEAYDYRQLADLIMANLSTLQKGMTEPEVYDFYHDKWITIPLKQSLTPQANAERLYQKGKRQDIELKIAEDNLEQAEAALAHAQEQYQAVMETDDLNSLKQQFQEVFGKPSRKSQKVQLKDRFKHFRVQRYDIYVGKGAAINDMLTFQFAQKSDIWLHAREQKGAHVIIRAGKDNEVPMPVIEAGAQLAGAYAKRKGETMTAVVYTRKKYVWKPRGAEPGQVNYQNEALLMVQPGIPELDHK